MKNLYALSMSAIDYRTRYFFHVAGFVLAVSEDEARGMGIKAAQEKFPAIDYIAHGVSVMFICPAPEDIIKAIK